MTTILIVNDDHFFRTRVKEVLEEEIPGIEVITAKNSDEMISAVEKHKPQLMVGDLIMPLGSYAPETNKATSYDTTARINAKLIEQIMKDGTRVGLTSNWMSVQGAELIDMNNQAIIEWVQKKITQIERGEVKDDTAAAVKKRADTFQANLQRIDRGEDGENWRAPGGRK